MTISRKLNKSLSTALITLLTLSVFVGLFSFANATTSSPATIAFSASGTTSFAQWDNSQAASGNFSAALGGTSATASDIAEVKLPASVQFGGTGVDFGNANLLNFSGYVVAAGAGLDTQLTLRLYMDSNGDGVSDYYFKTAVTGPASAAPSAGVGSWVSYSGNAWTVFNTTKQTQSTFGDKVHGVDVTSPADTYANWVALTGFAEDRVVGVAVDVVGAGNAVNVDLVTIQTTQYNLEPVAMTFHAKNALVQAATAPVGATVKILAGNASFTAGELVASFFQGVGPSINVTTASADGAVNGTFTVPALAAGAYTITSIGLTSGTSATGTFTITAPSITLTPSKASVGSSITVAGSNFKVSSTGAVNITFNGAPWSGTLLDTSSSGGFSTSLVVPNLAPGAYVVSATDGLNTATKTFTIPTVALTKVTPTSGPTGTAAQLTGEGFTISGLVQIFINGVLYKSGVADATGNLGSPVRDITINGAPGTVTISALDVTTGIATPSITFTIKAPALVAGLRIPSTSTNTTLTNGPVGATVGINGTNFKPSTVVNITLGVGGKQIVASLPTANANGFISAYAILPDVAPGEYVIAATDGVNTATTPFTVNAPAITLTTVAGPVGTDFTVKGTNFKADSAVTITWINGTTNVLTLNGATADENGTISVAQVVPQGPIGAYIVNATDDVNFAEATFNIGAAIMSLTPNQGPPGTLVNLQGKGFSLSGTVNVFLDATQIATVTANSTGGISLNVTIPDLTKGNHPFTAFDVTTALTTPAMNFKVSTPTLVTTPTESQVGQLVMVSGTLFKLNATVTITFNGVAVATLKANGVGTLPADANFTIPSVVPGVYVVNATDGVNFVTANFNVFGTGGIDQVIAMLSQYGSFWNLTNEINTKLGTFTGDDTVASLLYSIQSKVSVPNPLAFDFGTATAAWQPSVLHITEATVYSEDLGYGWTDTEGLGSRNRVSPNPALAGFVMGSVSKTFQVALPNGDYTVTVTQGDCNFAHDGMTIIMNGELVGTVSTAAGQSQQTQAKVTVEDGLLQITFGNAAGGTDPNWVVNGVTIFQNWT